MKKVIVGYKTYLIQPDHINTDPNTGPEGSHFFDAFGNTETEVSARWLVRFAQQRGSGWEPFALNEIEAFYNRGGHKGFSFNHLINPGQAFANAAEAFGAIASSPNSMAAVLTAAHQPTVSVGGGWIVAGDDEKYYFTHEFVSRCYQASPGLPCLKATTESTDT
ncbi:MAG: hypothetical protein M1324_04525 [Patescibacteria group bacterium]|nr:hypothetical protein [Patescibacteria group bacterium]